MAAEQETFIDAKKAAGGEVFSIWDQDTTVGFSTAYLTHTLDDAAELSSKMQIELDGHWRCEAQRRLEAEAYGVSAETILQVVMNLLADVCHLFKPPSKFDTAWGLPEATGMQYTTSF
mmetsp:Transcript_40148/g.63731  ORF Transcript_40148/g.63731 Transcript_40148/m.63731 type:complete len:118 (+) Transcript_40148:46-399(+)